MTGTALTEAEEFFNIYKLNVLSIPTNKKMIRKDFNDQIFRTEKEKNFAILKRSKNVTLKVSQFWWELLVSTNQKRYLKC